MSYNSTGYELHFHLLPFAPYWVLSCAKTPNQKITKTSNTRRSSLFAVSSLGFHRVASASLSSLVGNGYLQHDGPYWLGRSEPDRLIGWSVGVVSTPRTVKCLFPPPKTNTLRCCVWWMCVFVLQLYFQMHTGVPQSFEDFFPKDRFCFGSPFCFSPVRSELLRRCLP